MAIIYTARAERVESDEVKIYIYVGQTSRTLEERKKEHLMSAYVTNNPDFFHQTMRRMSPDDWIFTAQFECDVSEINERERELINQYREIASYSSGMIVLNDGHGKAVVRDSKRSRPDYGIPRAGKQKNYAPGEMGKKFARASGKLKPVINLKTKRVYDSTLEAEKIELVSKATIKISCATGKKLPDGAQYAYLDLNDNPILKEGHDQDIYIGKCARKVKELVSGTIYNNSTEVADKYDLSSSSVGGFASGKYLIAKDQYVFCYVDADGVELRTPRHEKALQEISKKERINYVAWPVNFFYEDAEKERLVGYFKTLDELYKKLNIKNKSHVKAVCDGKRSHVDGYRVAYYDSVLNKPVLTPVHHEESKKIIRKVQCLNDGHVFDNCTDAGYQYSVEANQIGMCAKGILKSVRVKNQETGKVERFRFAYLDKSNQPILTTKHNEPLLHRKGISKIVLINSNPEVLERLGTNKFSSLAEYCRKTGVPSKRARKYLKDRSIDLLGYEFVVID